MFRETATQYELGPVMYTREPRGLVPVPRVMLQDGYPVTTVTFGKKYDVNWNFATDPSDRLFVTGQVARLNQSYNFSLIGLSW